MINDTHNAPMNPQSVVAGSERVRISVVGKYNQYYNTLKSAHVVTSITDPG